MWNVSGCEMCQDVKCVRGWNVSGCEMCHDVKCVRMWNVSWCEMCQDVKWVRMWNVSRCEMCQDVKCVMMWNVSGCEMCQDVKCVRVWNVSGCEMCHDVKCVRMWNVSGCEMCQDVKCVRMWNPSGFVVKTFNEWYISKAHPGGRGVWGVVLWPLACRNCWVRIPSVTKFCVSREWCVLSSSLWDGTITRSDESCRMWCAWVWSWGLECGVPEFNREASGNEET